MTHRWAGVLPATLLLVGLVTGATHAPLIPPTNGAQPATVWFLTNQDRVGRIGPNAKAPKIYENPLHCAVAEDDCNLRGIAAANGSLWLPDANNGLRRIDPKTGRAANGPNDNRYSSAPVTWNGRLWFTNIDRTLAVEPPATRVAQRVTVPGAYAEALAPSHHYLWITGSGTTRSTPAAAARIDQTGRLAGRFTLPISDETFPNIAALDDRSAYMIDTPGSTPPLPPSRLLELTIGPTGRTAVRDLGTLSFDPGGMASVGGHLWINDVNAARLVELDRSGRPIGEARLDAPGDGHLIGAAGRLWILGDTSSGSELEVIDPQTRSIASITPITLPGTDRVGDFTVADASTDAPNG